MVHEFIRTRSDVFTGAFYGLHSANKDLVSITASSMNIQHPGVIYPEAILDDPSKYSYYQTADQSNSYLTIDINDDHRVFATHYSIEAISKENFFFPKSYVIEGKSELGWHVLDIKNFTKEQIQSKSLHAFPPKPAVFSSIRIWIESINVDGNIYASIKRFDVFGTLCSSPAVCVGNLYPPCQTFLPRNKITFIPMIFFIIF